MGFGVIEACVWFSVLPFTSCIIYLSLSYLIGKLEIVGIKNDLYHSFVLMMQLYKKINIVKVPRM